MSLVFQPNLTRASEVELVAVWDKKKVGKGEICAQKMQMDMDIRSCTHIFPGMNEAYDKM